MKFIKRSCAVLVLTLILTSIAFAGSEAVVSGTVYGPDGITVLPGITVELLNRATNFNRTVVTGTDGGYTIPNVPLAASYEISAIRNGAVLAKNAGIQLEVDLRTGHAAEVISEVASAGRYDLVVLGHRGHFLRDHLLGSTADRVAEHAPCPVMIVR